MIDRRNVITDLRREAEGGSPFPVSTQAAPACNLSCQGSHKDWMSIRTVFCKPCLSVFNAYGLCISRGLLRRYSLVVNIHNRRKIANLREANQYLLHYHSRRIYFQRCPYPYSPSINFPSAKRSKRKGRMSTVLGAPSRMSSTRLAPAAGEVLKPVPLNPQAR